MKTPEKYFMDEVNLPGEGPGDGENRPLTEAEQAFLDKYVGADQRQLLAEAPAVDPRGADAVPGFARDEATPDAGAAPETEPPGSFDDWLKEQQEVQLVSFMLGGREFALPITAIQEVIKLTPVTKLPSAPDFIHGIINLRGRVTPLLRLRRLLGLAKGEEQDRFTVICSHRGLQVGLLIHAVNTMYRVGGDEVEWGLESNVGVSAEFLVGLLKRGEKLVSILSIDSLTEGVLRMQGGVDA